MSEEVARFEPRNRFGGYNCALEVLREVGGGSRVFLRPTATVDYVNEDDLQLLMGIDKIKRYPFEYKGVRIEKMFVPDYEIRLSRNRRPLSFEESVAFFNKITTLVRKN